MLGLGHLGQGYLWSLAFLPFPHAGSVEFLLHDFDQIDESNFGSGLLCVQGALKRKKTRHCADWLEHLGFSTRITERRFTTVDRRGDADPAIAFCGFDNVSARQGLDTAGFGLVLECGLGGGLADFDQIDVHTFPSRRHSAHSLWGHSLIGKPLFRKRCSALCIGRGRGLRCLGDRHRGEIRIHEFRRSHRRSAGHGRDPPRLQPGSHFR
jgi:hypothetical protein